MATGMIKTLVPGKGLGLLVSGGEQTAYLFPASAVVGGHFGALRIGQWVSFDEEPDPCESGHRRAANLRPIDGAPLA